ncbi:MAG: 23S rRNA (adenine(2503)-C(2))-methyltransferase RlmN [Firmicutes bacterium]|nr:23S rRNA (adenine(2503)-C(2))-methyltransferase RlmN [Bacillota bacterium]
MQSETTFLVGKTKEELENLLKQWEEPSYRAEQVAHWLYSRFVDDIQKMSNLPLSLREHLARETSLGPLTMINVQHSIDGTRKYLFALKDGPLIEAVFIPEKRRQTVCVSTQAGCGMGCVFCATGQGGLSRNLTAGEIVDQILQIGQDVGRLPSNVVFMGMGEPLANYDAVMKSIEIINAPWGLHIGSRSITVSSCGLVPGIRRLASEKLGLTLAISLHAAFEDKRSKIMPINKKHSISDLMSTLREYIGKTKRRITIEYALMDGFNDTHADAVALAVLLKGLLCHVNLIPVNPIAGEPFLQPRRENVEEFKDVLKNHKIAVSVRKERGQDIAAACGQLKGQWEAGQL